MTVPVQDPVAAFVANGVTTVFPFDFLVTAADDLYVEVAGVEVTSGFTLSGLGVPAGGAVTFSVAPANLASVVIERNVEYGRTTDYQVAGDFRSEVVNPDFDRIVQMIQQLYAGVRRAFKLPVQANADGANIPYPLTPNAVWQNRSDGTGVQFVILDGTGSTLRPDLALSSGAGLIGTADVGGFYTSATVEGNLQELGASVDDVAYVDYYNAWTINQKITVTGNDIPSWSVYRNDSTPNVGDTVGESTYIGNNSAAAATTYGQIRVLIVDKTAGAEVGEISFDRPLAGSAGGFRMGYGLYSYADGLADMGAGTGNFTEVYRNGVAIPGAGLGAGQTWATQTRSVGTTYTNSTGKPIAVALTYTGSATTITVAGALIYTDQSAVAGSTITGTVFVVPDGATYVVGGATVSSWFELR